MLLHAHYPTTEYDLQIDSLIPKSISELMAKTSSLLRVKRNTLVQESRKQPV